MPCYVTFVRTDGTSNTIGGLTYEQANRLYYELIGQEDLTFVQWGELMKEPLNCWAAHAA